MAKIYYGEFYRRKRKGNMRIGIDIDNVISNFNDELLKEYLEHDKK